MDVQESQKQKRDPVRRLSCPGNLKKMDGDGLDALEPLSRYANTHFVIFMVTGYFIQTQVRWMVLYCRRGFSWPVELNVDAMPRSMQCSFAPPSCGQQEELHRLVLEVDSQCCKMVELLAGIYMEGCGVRGGLERFELANR